MNFKYKSLILYRCSILFSILSLQIAFVSVSSADEGDVFNTLISVNYLHDSNVFRLPDGVSAVADKGRSDTLMSTSIGFKVNKSYSLQKFNFEYTRNENSYNSFKFLDYSADLYKAGWNWSITPELTGTVAYNKSTLLAGFTDYRDFTNPNYRTTENKIGSIEYSPYGNWYLNYTKNYSSLSNSQVFLADSDVEIDSNKFGIRYKFPSSSYSELNYYERNGTYNKKVSSLFAADYTEKAMESLIKVVYSGKTTFTTSFGHVARSYQTLSFRDYDSPYGSLVMDYVYSGHLSVSMGARREISNFSTFSSSFTETDTYFIRPVYQLGPHLALSGNMQESNRTFKGQGVVSSQSLREDDQRTYGVTLSWYPRPTIQVGLNAQRDARRSTNSSLNYNDDSVGVSAQLLF